jgi:predicted nucleotidyltransferase
LVRSRRRDSEVRPAELESTRPPSHPTQFAELNELLDELVLQVGSTLGESFVGAYLQGSFALGDADLYSDCDFVVVVASPLALAQEQRIRALHAELPARPEHWAHHLEGSYAPRDELRSLSELGRRWLFVDHGHREMEWSTHCNTEVVRWILREHGVTLAGPSPQALVDQVPPEVLRARMREEVDDFLPGMLT